MTDEKPDRAALQSVGNEDVVDGEAAEGIGAVVTEEGPLDEDGLSDRLGSDFDLKGLPVRIELGHVHEDSLTQCSEVGGFQEADGGRVGEAIGVAVGLEGQFGRGDPGQVNGG